MTIPWFRRYFSTGSAIEQAATTVYNSYDSAYSYYDLNWDWDDTLPEMGAVISGLPSNEVAAAFQHPDTTTVNLVWAASITQMDNFSDWSSIKAESIRLPVTDMRRMRYSALSFLWIR